MPAALLDPAVLNAIRDLELVARLTVDGAVSGLHRSPFHGYSAEFSEFRHYRPGDDLKHVDWKLSARTDRLYTRQYRETTNMLAQLAVDASASMAFRGGGSVTKLEYARLVAGALAHLVARQGDAVGLVTYDSGLRDYIPPRGGRLHLRRLLVTLRTLQPSGRTASSVALRRAIDLLKGRGLLMLVSDLYDEGEAVESELRRAVRIGHEVAVFHALAPDEIALPFRTEVELEDLETGERFLTGAGTAQVYRDGFDAFLERWRITCAREGIEYTRVSTDQPLDAALRTYLLRRTRSDHR